MKSTVYWDRHKKGLLRNFILSNYMISLVFFGILVALNFIPYMNAINREVTTEFFDIYKTYSYWSGELYVAQDLMAMMGLEVLLMVISGILIGTYSMRPLLRMETSLVIHSLPLKKEEIFKVYSLGTILNYTIPMLLVFLMMLIGSFVVNPVFVASLIVMWVIVYLFGLLTISIFLLATSLSGNSFVALIVGVIIGFGPLALVGLVNQVMSNYVNGFVYWQDEKLLWLSPYGSFYHIINNVDSYTGGGVRGAFISVRFELLVLVVLIGFYLWLGVRFYSRRIIESMDLLNKAWIKKLMTFMITSIVGLGMASLETFSIRSSNVLVNMIVGGIIGVVVGYTISIVLTKHTFNFIRYYKGLIVYLIGVFGFLVLLIGGGNVYYSQLPETGDINHVYFKLGDLNRYQVDGMFNEYETIFFADEYAFFSKEFRTFHYPQVQMYETEDTIESVMKLSSALVDKASFLDAQERSESYSSNPVNGDLILVMYLNNGNTVKRIYKNLYETNLLTDPANSQVKDADLLAEVTSLQDSEEFRIKTDPLLKYDNDLIVKLEFAKHILGNQVDEKTYTVTDPDRIKAMVNDWKHTYADGSPYLELGEEGVNVHIYYVNESVHGNMDIYITLPGRVEDYILGD